MKSAALIAALVAAALAQQWEFEQVDSAGWGASVEMRWHPDGRLFLCYSDTTGTIRLASLDTYWHYESVPTVGQPLSGTQAFDIDLRGDIGVSYVDTGGYYRYALKTGAGWADLQTPFREWPEPSPTTLDTSGMPAITFQHGDAFLLARMRDTLRATDTLATGEQQWNPFFGAYALGSRADGVVWGVFYYSYSYPGQDIFGNDLSSFYASDSGITYHRIAGGYEYSIGGVSGCLDRQGFVHACYEYWWQMGSGLYLDQTQIAPDLVERTALKFDSLGRPQTAYVPRDGGLLYRYLGLGGWHAFDLQTPGVAALDLILDENAQPLIAYTTGAGVFLAHGVDIVGQSEEPRQPTAYGLRPTASVVRNILFLPSSHFTLHSSLFDMTGRRAMSLRPGANDVRHLPEGVYFVRDFDSAPTRKVVVMR